MKKPLNSILLFILIVFVIIQFFRPEKNISQAPQPANITNLYSTSKEVEAILKTACYDCHSNNTQYPWYVHIQPIGWFLSNHVHDGKQELNFDEFGNYRAARKLKKMEEVIEQVKEGEMPLSSYTFIHSNAKLNNQQKQLLIQWAEQIEADLHASYPADSLKLPRKS